MLLVVTTVSDERGYVHLHGPQYLELRLGIVTH